jgi:disulfide bond formation protein DsbB
MIGTSSRTAAALSTAAALTALLIALGSERVIALLLPRAARIATLWLLVLALAAAAALAFVHVGVEQGYWPSPLPECAAPHFTGDFASLPARPSKPCDDPTFLIPGLPLSMAAMNLLYALVFGASLAIYLLRNAGRRS